MDDPRLDPPPCPWCGSESVQPVPRPEPVPVEHWFNCPVCRRLFVVRFTPEASARAQ